MLFQPPIVRAVTLEPVHVYPAYVAQHIKRAPVPVLHGHFEHGTARQRLHD